MEQGKERLIRIPVKVVPAASRNEVAGWLGSELKVRVTAAPERGKANSAVEQVVADLLGLSKQSVNIIARKTSTRKILEISGLSKSEIYQR
ncbi:MAG: DUF167 domain-containing protein, partial [Planctomycetales bacterium]